MAQTEVLLTKEPAPQTIEACDLPHKKYDVACNTGAYTSSGLATTGFRTARYLMDEWFQNSYAQYHRAFADRDNSERQRHEAKQLAAETEALAQRTQQDSTRKVGERLEDMHCWKSELQREAEELTAETDLMMAQKLRLARALDATAVLFSIATDNLQCRERRQHPDLVRDYVEVELLKETELIRNIQELLKRTISQAVGQIRLNREHKETCEIDWSDKVEAYNIDDTCTRYNNQCTQVQFYPHSSKFEESASTPETWAKFTQDNLIRAERERLASVNLRKLIDSILRDTSEDLRLQCDTVNLAFSTRCKDLDDALHKLHYHLHKTLREIADQEHQVAALKQAIKDKEAPLRVAQTRLYQRSHKPNVELCRDAAQFRLMSEVEELMMSLSALKEKLLDSEQALRNLEDSRMSLEKDIAVKTNSLFIDRQKCMVNRNRYPSALQLAGY
ncbi:tektin-4 isoform X1 [Cricetulus griseus]|uniref:Tektin n=1 Tax=Cricetulus griseus TaxID=10029 RepID=G3HBW2_CRIGR|nr:tektin-4 isoform X1 [Cricetulus griseus]XP_027280634.1 tektin-4 isoform X2 [Cricetulus griseus]EGW04399.1 Tektin-4 [Cricetulus griseus]ERE68694.1 tektin-4 [Cricetulus griseus]